MGVALRWPAALQRRALVRGSVVAGPGVGVFAVAPIAVLPGLPVAVARPGGVGPERRSAEGGKEKRTKVKLVGSSFLYETVFFIKGDKGVICCHKPFW